VQLIPASVLLCGSLWIRERCVFISYAMLCGVVG